MDLMLIGMAVMLAGAIAAILSSRRSRGFVPSPAVVPGGYRLATVGGLSRVELVRFVRHPLVIVGLLLVAVLGRTMLAGDESRAVLNGLGLWPVLLFGFVTVHLAVSRDRRAGAEELTGSLPAEGATRTLAHVASVAVVALTLAALWFVFALAVLGSDRTTTVRTWSFSGIEWTPSVFEFAQPLLVAVAILTLAVAVGRWWRHPVAAFVVPFVLFMSPLMWFVPPVVDGGLVESGGRLVEVPASEVAWHLVYLAGWVAVFAALALLRHDRRPLLGGVALAGLVAVVAGFVLGPLPLS